jgi:putative transposase
MARQLKRARQLELHIRTWGGKRKRAGRKVTGAGVSHLRRPDLPGRFPVHVTVRMLPHVWNLRSRRSFTVFRVAFCAAANRLGTRVCEFSVQGNHLHLVVETEGKVALAGAMKGLGVRIARRLNRIMKNRQGRVVADRYHAHVLRTPTEVRRAVHYVRNNYHHHQTGVSASFVDPYSSASGEHGVPLPEPLTWLLRSARAAVRRAAARMQRRSSGLSGSAAHVDTEGPAGRPTRLM